MQPLPAVGPGSDVRNDIAIWFSQVLIGHLGLLVQLGTPSTITSPVSSKRELLMATSMSHDQATSNVAQVHHYFDATLFVA